MAKSNDKKISTKEIENFLLDEDVRLCMDWGKERNPFAIIESGERLHSKMLAWLLNPREGHLQGDYFIKALIRTVLETYKDAENISVLEKNAFFKERNVFDIEQTSFANAVVWPEFQISSSQAGKRVDIAMFDEANELFLFIENKFGSPEGKDQTTEYFKGLEKLLKPLNHKDPPYRLYIFLDYNENKANSKDWISLNYDWLQNALKQLIDRDAIPAGVEYVLKGYYEYLSDDYSSTPYHSGPEKHLPAIARKHQNLLKFMRKHKNELAKQTTERLLLDEPKKIKDVTTDQRTSQNHRLQPSQSDQRAHLCVLCCFRKHTDPFRAFKKKIGGGIDHQIASLMVNLSSFILRTLFQGRRMVALFF